jgi:hypothetical protein
MAVPLAVGEVSAIPEWELADLSAYLQGVGALDFMEAVVLEAGDSQEEVVEAVEEDVKDLDSNLKGFNRRILIDRRKQPTSALSRYTLWGTRRSFRRKVDQEGAVM